MGEPGHVGSSVIMQVRSLSELTYITLCRSLRVSSVVMHVRSLSEL